MKMTRHNFVNPVGIFFLVCLPAFVNAQPAPILHHTQPMVMRSGMYEGRVGVPSLQAFHQVVRIPNAPWLRLHFSDHHLGEQSYITITSRQDGARQRLDATSLKQWQNKSAFFNGDAVEVELHVFPDDTGVFFEIEEVMVGERGGVKERAGEAPQPSARPSPEAICGGGDDRVASSDPAVGRIVPSGCTGWITSNGAYLSAGHCFGAGNQILQFNVPMSNSDGTINHPPADDQYPIVSVTKNANGVGKDWAVVGVMPNANTGLLPVHAQKAFYRMSKENNHLTNPIRVRVTGHGLDGPPSCFGDPSQPGCDLSTLSQNADNQTQQTHSGVSVGEIGDFSFGGSTIKYEVDTQGGNSGSPIIIDGEVLTVGIHTHGGCSGGFFSGTNRGTSFANHELAEEIQTFPGEQVVYVDKGHTISGENGTVFRPFEGLTEAITAVPAGGLISIVTGSYNSGGITLNKAMALTAPVGAVTIGE